MKNRFLLFVLIFLMSSWHHMKADAVSVVIPKQYLIEKASLVLYMLDELGNQCVGTCQLNETFEQRNILQEELKIQPQDIVSDLSDIIEISNSLSPCDNDVVLLHIEFDNDVRVVRILIVKETVLTDDSYSFISIAVEDEDSGDDCDDMLSDLIEGLDSSTMRSAPVVQERSSLFQYALYAKIYCMMHYKHAKRKVKNLTTWLCKKK